MYIFNIYQTVDTPNRRLELRFRPDDGYSKPTCGDRHSTTAFLLRVRIKKCKAKQVRNIVLNTVKSKSMNDSLESIASCINYNEENLNASYMSGDKQTDNQTQIMMNKDNHEGIVVNNLVNQIQNCSINSPSYDTGNPSNIKSISNDSENSCNISIDTDGVSSKWKKDTLPTFDHNKYENLSQDIDYELPRLKVLGRVDTEFKFFSMFSIVENIISVLSKLY